MSELGVLFPDKTLTAIKSKATKLKLRKPPRFKFTPEIIEKIKEVYPKMLNRDIAEIIGCSIHSIENLSYRLGLKKDKEFLKSVFSERMQNPNHPGRKYWHKKGEIPFNKGKKQTEFMSPEKIEKTKATRFKKGTVPPNRRNVGEKRITKDGYIEIKVAEGLKQWNLLHRVVWEEQNGVIPKGYNIQFKDGNRQNCNIENLYIISRKKQMTENTMHRYPEELRSLIRAKGLLKRYINKQLKIQKDE